MAALLAGLASSCLAAPTSPAPPSITPASSTTVTVAFPTVIPTPTWTPGPTQTPTIDVRPGLGPVVLQDSFDDPSAWDLQISENGAAGISDGHLTLAVRSPRVYQRTRRQAPSMANFFAEVEVHTSLCTAGDEYGLTARGNDLGEQYRFLIGCDGTARITRVLESSSRALTLRVETPAVIPGAPAVNRLAVWAKGLDLKLFVNGAEVIAARDAALDQGTFGFIARAGSGGQVAVGFDNLIVREVFDPKVTSIPAATPAPSP